jgi:hypothetical protein
MPTPVEPETAERRLTLLPGGLKTFVGDVGQVVVDVCPVVALAEPNLEPASGVVIRYRIESGPFQFITGEADEVEVLTDAEGRADLSLRVTDEGSGIVSACLADSSRYSIDFLGQSAGTVYRLEIQTLPAFGVDTGVVSAQFVALDYHSRPVLGARLAFEGYFGDDIAVEGSVTELGNGLYEGRFVTRVAGVWRLTAQDLLTKAEASTSTHVVPGKPESIRIQGPLDPRCEAPFDQTLLRVRLEDRFHNAIDPHILRATANSNPQQPLFVSLALSRSLLNGKDGSSWDRSYAAFL